MTKRLNAILVMLLLCSMAWGVRTKYQMTDLGSGTPTSSTFLRGDGTWSSAITNNAALVNATTVNVVTLNASGSVVAAGVNISTASINATGVGGTATASFGANCTNGTGQPVNTTQQCWVRVTIDGSTTFVPGFR